MTALGMLDLSAAFDVIDYQILLKCLEFSFGIKEKTLIRLKSYLADRTQCISMANKTWPGEIIKRYNTKYHCYADDTQVYMTLNSCDKWNDISSSIKACIANISTWMNSNMLKLNKEKT